MSNAARARELADAIKRRWDFDQDYARLLRDEIEAAILMYEKEQTAALRAALDMASGEVERLRRLVAQHRDVDVESNS